MITVSVVYHSTKGHTAALAEALAHGAASVAGVEVHLLRILPSQIVEGRWNDADILAKLEASDAIVFGCPTYMGSVSAVFKAFLEKAFDLWFDQRWKDKIAAGFTNSASQSGDKLSTLLQLSVFAMQMSMLWVSVGDPPGNNWSGGSVNDVNRLGAWMGVMGQSNGDQGPEQAPPESDRKTAERFGRRVAEVTRQWRGQGTYMTERIKAL